MGRGRGSGIRGGQDEADQRAGLGGTGQHRQVCEKDRAVLGLKGIGQERTREISCKCNLFKG